MSVTRSTPKFVYDPTGNESAELSFDTLNLDDETGIMVSDLVSDVNGIKNSFKAALKALPKNTLKGKQYWRFDDTVAHLGKLGYKLEARLESGESGKPVSGLAGLFEQCLKISCLTVAAGERSCHRKVRMWCLKS
ncbi:hypothetical protein QFC19_008637 [Naganishia cerealis]|uniref:Uncharacterized protein n=1 Tax=Naganishia cerealis TaxID=610337 RepID=A0ACC2V125_9TREE|nr:hypothetical protein QFC19_008637 [Naganishia cerealis]